MVVGSFAGFGAVFVVADFLDQVSGIEVLVVVAVSSVGIVG